MDHTKIRSEAQSVGCEFGTISGDNVQVQAGDEALAALIIAAHGKTTTDPEIAALRDYLGGELDTRWINYVIVRQRAIRDMRNAKFQTLTDPMILDTLEACDVTDLGDGFCTIQLPLEALEAWKAAKAAIRAELPYEVE